MLRSTLLAAALGAGLAIAGPIDSLLSTSQHVLGGSQAAVRSPMTVLSAADVEADGHEFETVSLASLADHSLRIKKPTEPLCESAGVDQYSGGPGCSSSTGLLFELGPCRIAANGTGTELNANSWNNHANMIFLDQPIQVGYSYSSDGDQVNNTPDAAVDVYAFLQLFYAKFPHYKSVPFHIAAESYGGHYAPQFAAYIHNQNVAIAAASALAPIPHKHIPLESVLIGNGLTEPYTQFATVPEFACAPSPTAIFDDATCTSIRSKVGTCQRLQQWCYNSPSRFTCTPAALYCWSNIVGPIQQTGLNPYNVKAKCDRAEDKDGPLCYRELTWVETWLNRPDVKKSLGVPSKLTFTGCNMEVNKAFMMQGDGMHNSAELIPPMLDAGIRFLIYAGELDFMVCPPLPRACLTRQCNWIGNRDWVLKLENRYHQELIEAKPKTWTGHRGKLAGEVTAAGNGSFAFIKVARSGHMVPADQPENAAYMSEHWIAGKPIADK